MSRKAIRNFVPEDLKSLGAMGSLLEEEANGLFQNGLSFTATLDGEPVLSGGLILMWPGVAEAWAALGVVAKNRVAWSHRLVKRTLYQLIEKFGIHRVQMHVNEDDQIGMRWAEALGFEREGVAHCYTKDAKNMVCYAMWRK